MLETTPTRPQASRLWWVFTILLATILLSIAFRGVDWAELVTTLQHARIEYLALAFLVLSGSYFLRGMRWRILLSAEKLIAPLTVFWAIVVGYLGNSFLPARAGELIRSVMIGRNAKISKSYVLATALTERIIDVVALVLISLIALGTLAGVAGWLLAGVRVMTIVGLVGLVGVLIAPRLDVLIKRLLAIVPMPSGLREKVGGLLEQFLLGMRAFQHPGRAISFLAYTSVIWLIDAVMAMTIAQALNLGLSLPEALLLLAALGLASAAPSTPGYVGIYQFVAVSVFIPFGFSRADALVYIIAFQAVSYAVVIVWGTTGLWCLRLAPSVAPTNSQM